MANRVRKFGGVLAIVALLVALAWTPGEAGLGGIQRTLSVNTSDSVDLVETHPSDDVSRPWYYLLLQPILSLTLTW